MQVLSQSGLLCRFPDLGRYGYQTESDVTGER